MSRAHLCTCDDCADAPGRTFDALLTAFGLVAFAAIPGRALIHLLAGALS